jgi:rhamnosyltransferase
MKEGPRVSVVVPVRNDKAGIVACLAAIQSQTVRPHEIIVIDSGSTDGTAEAASQFASVRLVRIDPGQFNHGTTRNLGVSLAAGDYVLLTVQDARPVHDNWIESLLAGFVDEDVAAVCGHQAVERRRDTNPVEWYRPYSQPAIKTYRFKSAKDFESASPEERGSACGWDNVTAMYRRDVLLKVPFRKVVFGEDLLFAVDAYKAGYALAFNPAAVVWHYHFEPGRLTFERTIRAATTRALAFGLATPPPKLARSLLSVAKRLATERELSWSERLFWFAHNAQSLLVVGRACRLANAALQDGSVGLDHLIQALGDRPPQAVRLNGAFLARSK